MAHTDHNRRDGRPEDIAGADDSAGMDENTVLVESSILDEDSRLDEDAGPGEITGTEQATAPGETTGLGDTGVDGPAGAGEASGIRETSGPGLRGGPAEPELAHEPAGAGASGLSGASTMSAAREADARPANAGERDRFAARWQEIQAEFVNDPRRAVLDADALIADMMERLARLLASEREQIESRAGTGDVSTEDLRQGLQRYRSLFQRLLAA